MFQPRNGSAPSTDPSGEDGQDQQEESEYKFVLPPDEEGMVYQCHMCSYTGSSRCSFNAHVNTHYEFQCGKCDFVDKVSS